MKRKKYKHYRLEFWTAADSRSAFEGIRTKVTSARVIEGEHRGWDVVQRWRNLVVEVKVPMRIEATEVEKMNFGIHLASMTELDPLETLAKALK